MTMLVPCSPGPSPFGVLVQEVEFMIIAVSKPPTNASQYRTAQAVLGEFDWLPTISYGVSEAVEFDMNAVKLYCKSSPANPADEKEIADTKKASR